MAKYHIKLETEEMKRLLDMLKFEEKRHHLYAQVNPIDIKDRILIEKIRKVWYKEMEKQYLKEKEEEEEEEEDKEFK